MSDQFDFRHFKEMAVQPIDEVADLLVTHTKAKDLSPDSFLFKLFERGKEPLKVLDFGCGMGRNAFGMQQQFPHWSVYGYDCTEMLSRAPEYFHERYPELDPATVPVTFMSNWDAVKALRFDCIVTTLCLQHIKETDLLQYAADFSKMTRKLVVAGRVANDDRGLNTFDILARAGLSMSKCLREGGYSLDCDPNEHFTCVYNFKSNKVK